MPTRRMFDLVVITTLLLHPVVGLVKMQATRVAGNPNSHPFAQVLGGAARIAS